MVGYLGARAEGDCGPSVLHGAMAVIKFLEHAEALGQNQAVSGIPALLNAAKEREYHIAGRPASQIGVRKSPRYR
eukprot:4789294-Prorocentrum_lima.AAC.1